MFQERLVTERQRWLQEKDSDILAPFLIRLNHEETLSAEDAKRLHHDCVTEFKQRLVEHGNLIQERYEKVSGWYRTHMQGSVRVTEAKTDQL